MQDDWNEERIDIIGQNGNTGEHYKMSGGMEEAIREEREQQALQFKSRVRDQKPTTDLVIGDILQRHEMGLLKYGKFLSCRTDEDMLQHLYEELLDASMYIKTLIIQRQQGKRHV